MFKWFWTIFSLGVPELTPASNEQMIIMLWVTYISAWTNSTFARDIIQTSCSLSGEKIADFSEQCSRRVSSVIGAYWNPCKVDYDVTSQRAKKVVSDSLGLVDFAIGLVNSVFNLPDGQVMFLRNSNNWRTVKSINIVLVKKFWGLREMASGLGHASFSLPD